jgi:7,8-dihydropterin-6-yl-methyl-4-(beta-D-ribofuranosyl)aminobenzene 5'-phosphate synthase
LWPAFVFLLEIKIHIFQLMFYRSGTHCGTFSGEQEFVMFSHNKIIFTIFFICVLLTPGESMARQEEQETGQGQLRFHVIFNNVAYRTDLQTSWGFACLIEGPEITVLFDTGGDGGILLDNLQRMNLDPGIVKAVVLSHIHGDHTGGLEDFLSQNPDVTVYMPASFPDSFRDAVQHMGAATRNVSQPQQLVSNMYSTGEMNGSLREQALIVDSREGLIVITGCAHPNVADMAEQAKAYLGKKIYILMGGFHLGGKSDTEVQSIIERLKALGVQKVAPSHCTGDRAIRLFREAWAEDFIEGGLGAVISVPR